MVRVPERGSGSGCVGISDVTIAFIKDVVVSSAAFHTLIKARQRFIQLLKSPRISMGASGLL